jgi:hypothetical protein
LIWPDTYLIYSNTSHSIYLARQTRFYPKNQKTIGTIQYSTKNPRHLNLGLNIIDNRRLTENCFRLTIQCLKITGSNITRGQTSGCAAAKKPTRPSGVIATIVGHRQNAASGRSYLSSDAATLRFVGHYCIVNNNGPITKLYRAINARTILYILAR